MVMVACSAEELVFSSMASHAAGCGLPARLLSVWPLLGLPNNTDVDGRWERADPLRDRSSVQAPEATASALRSMASLNRARPLAPRRW